MRLPLSSALRADVNVAAAVASFRVPTGRTRKAKVTLERPNGRAQPTRESIACFHRDRHLAPEYTHPRCSGVVRTFAGTVVIAATPVTREGAGPSVTGEVGTGAARRMGDRGDSYPRVNITFPPHPA